MNPDQRNQLEELLEAWFVRLEAGETPDPAEHCAAHPDLADEFARLLGRAEEFDDLFSPRPRANDDVAPPPDQLGDYELIAPIGHGGSGEVWLARQTSLRRLVALKLVKSAGDPRTQRRLRREAEVAASLDHPGIVPIYAVGEHGNRSWIAMKWLTGPALDAIGAPLPPERAAGIAAAVAQALHEAHSAGIIHRDVKPSNIVLDGDNPCLVDFGLARDGAEVTRTTVAGHVSGTLLYMSPEQLRSGGTTTTLDARTDIYSLGATLYELLSGRAPFEGDHPGKVIHQILEGEPAPLSVSRDLATIVFRALDKDRERRFPTALEMALDLERYLAGEPIQSRPVGLSTRVWKLARRNRTATAMIGAAVLVAAGLGVSLGWTVYERARLLESGVARVRQAIQINDMASAQALLTQLLADAPDELEVQSANRQLVACLALDELLDRVQALPEDADPEELRAVATAIHADDLPEHRCPEYSLALPLALAICGDYQAAHALVDALPDSRGRDALRAAIATAENDWQDTGAWQLGDGKSPIDHLFTALAMRLAQRPLQERRVEINLARKFDATGWRVRLQHAIQLVNEKDHTAALEALGGLPRGDAFPRIVRRLMMFEAIKLGNNVEARSQLHAFLAEHDRSTWTAADAACVLEACFWLDEPAAEILSFARHKWPTDSMVKLLAARAIQRTDPDGARQLLAVLAANEDMARTPVQRDRVRLTAMWLEVAQVMPFWLPWDDEVDDHAKTWLRDLAEKAGLLAAKTKSAEVRLDSSLLQARALFAARDMPAARAVLSQLDANAPAVVLERAHHTYLHYLMAAYVDHGVAAQWQMDALADARKAMPQGWSRPMRDIRPRLTHALGKMPPGELFLGKPARPIGWLLAALLALADNDLTEAKTAADTARQLLLNERDNWKRKLLNYVDSAIRGR